MIHKTVLAATLIIAGPAVAQTTTPESCTEVGRGKICSSAVNSGLNLVVSINVTVPPDGALAVMEGFAEKDKNALFACRITANNRASHKEAVFARAPADVLSRMHDAPVIESGLTPDKRLNCKFERRVLTASSGPYEYRGPVPKDIAPCGDKLLGRINAAGLTVKKQTNSTMFFETEHDEFTARCALYKNAITGAISGPKLCKPTAADLKPLFDMIGAPEKDRKKLVDLAATSMRKVMRKKDQTTAQWNGYEVTTNAGSAPEDCLVVLYPPESEAL